MSTLHPSRLLLTLACLLTAVALGGPRVALAQEDDEPVQSTPRRVIQHHEAKAGPANDDEDDAPASVHDTPPPPVQTKAPVGEGSPPPGQPEPEVREVSPAPTPKARPEKGSKRRGKHAKKKQKQKKAKRAKVSKQKAHPVRTAEPAAKAVHPVVPATAAGEGEARESAAVPPPSMDFDLLPEKSTVGPDALALESKVKIRREMLQLHQIFGIATVALMVGTVVTGQLNYSDRFGGGGSSGQFEIWHSGLEAATVVSFATTGLLALLAPVPFKKKSEGIDTLTIHKWSMLVATLGMAAEVPLGIYTVTREGYVNQATMALTHLILGYITAAALTTGAAAIFF